MNLKREILSKISDRRLETVDKSFANELGLSLKDFEEQLKVLQEDNLLEFRPLTFRSWNVRITSDGYKFLNKTAEDE